MYYAIPGNFVHRNEMTIFSNENVKKRNHVFPILLQTHAHAAIGMIRKACTGLSEGVGTQLSETKRNNAIAFTHAPSGSYAYT